MREADADRVVAPEGAVGDGNVRAGHLVEVLRKLARRVARALRRVLRHDDRRLREAVLGDDELVVRGASRRQGDGERQCRMQNAECRMGNAE